MRELAHLLPELTPPPGGLARLRHSLRTRREPAHRRLPHWLPALAGTGALALLALIWLPGFVNRERATDALTQALLQTTTPPPLPHGIHVEHGAALPLANDQPDARIYLIASTPPAGQ